LNFAEQEKDSEIQLEAVSCLTSILTGNAEQIQTVVNRNAIKILKNVIKTPIILNKSKAILALSNIAGENSELRDLVLKEDVLPLVASYMTPTAPNTLLKCCSWCISNLCRGKPAPDPSLVLPALNSITQILTTQEDPEIIRNAIWTLYFISDGGGPKLTPIIKTNIIPTIVKLVYSPEVKISVPSIRVLGNITTGTDAETQMVINAGGIEALKHAMQGPYVGLRKDACWAMSNITVENIDQINQVLKADVIPLVCKILREDDMIVKEEATWIITNLSSVINAESIERIMNSELISLLPALLKIDNIKILVIALQFLANILKQAKKHYGDNNALITQIEKLGCLNILEQLQYHENQFVYKIVNSILEGYFLQDCIEETLEQVNDPASISIFNF